MDATTFLDCPAYLNGDGTIRCGLPAVVEDRYTLVSADGPVTSVKIHCPAGHWFNGPVSALTVQANTEPSAAPVAVTARASSR